jgi:fructoselysine-6-P-deglycase FrlB-like protein
VAKKIVEEKYARLYLVGMGSSYSAALMGAEFSRHISRLPVEIYRGYELEFQRPVGLGKDCCVVAISFSGQTEDTVSAMRFAKSRTAYTAYTASISGPEENTLAREVDDAVRIVSSDSKAAMVAAHLS